MTCHLNFKTNKIKIGFYEIWHILCCCCFSFFLKLSHWLQHKYVTNCEISGSFKYSIPMVYIITEWSVSTPLKSFLGIRWVITKDNKSFPFSDRSFVVKNIYRENIWRDINIHINRYGSGDDFHSVSGFSFYFFKWPFVTLSRLITRNISLWNLSQWPAFRVVFTHTHVWEPPVRGPALRHSWQSPTCAAGRVLPGHISPRSLGMLLTPDAHGRCLESSYHSGSLSPSWAQTSSKRGAQNVGIF